ncbi:MAG TPA: hypothetical protein VGY76_11980 [Solirubrobacteraceae bacterium]|jgi:hypothetical protein|nr:hypothetical protein [Solirubrobacteraceae bacterium]
MNNGDSPLQITYTGDPVRVNHERITEDMWVPNLGFDGHQCADDLPGASAASLFREAEGEGALVVPVGIVVDCYSRDTHLTHDFMLVVSPPGENQAGITQGWFDVELLTREVGDGRTDNDPEVVREALEVMAAKLNAVLNGE